MTAISVKERRQKLGLCIYCGRGTLYKGQYCEVCYFKTVSRNVKRQHKRREQVIDAYGNICSCCKKKYPYKYYEIDHKDGNGKTHREQIGRGSTHIVDWIIANNYPDSIQIMCSCCHKAKTGYNGCTEEDHKILLNT